MAMDSNNIELYISLLSLALMCKIGFLHATGVSGFRRRIEPTQETPLRRLSGAIVALGAVWIALQMLQIRGVIEVSNTIYILFLGALILCEVCYLVKLMSRATPTSIPTPSDSDKEPNVEESKQAEAEAEALPESPTFEQIVKGLIEESEEEKRAKADSEQYRAIAEAFEVWVAKREYLDQGVTIQRVAVEIKSNRTYLSAYINAKYNTTFRDWVTAKRLEEARRLLTEERDILISDVAQRVGFATVASFSRAFTRQEGLSPVAWRASQP